MKIIKRSSDEIQIEEAHGGSGSRKVYANAELSQTDSLEAVTHGYLPSGKAFDWHDHKDTEETMIVLKGTGKVFDEDGEYDYATGDVYIFPPNVQHRIVNISETQSEMIFIRVMK